MAMAVRAINVQYYTVNRHRKTELKLRLHIKICIMI